MKIFASCMYFFIFFAQAERIRIGADLWSEYTLENGSGIYFDLLNEIYGKENIDLKIESYHRSLKSFEEQKIDILVGVFREDVKQAILPKWFLDTDDPILVFYHPKSNKISNISDLSKLSNAWRRGYHFERFIDQNPKYYEVNSPKEGFSLLANKRVDTFIDYLSNVPLALAQQFEHFELLPSRHLYLAFQENKEK